MADLPLTIPDLLWVDDMDLFAGETTSDLQTLRQDVYHMLIEATFSNPDAPNRSIGLARLLSGTEADLVAIIPTIDAKLQLDPRIDSAQTTLTKLPPGSMLPDGTPLPNGGYSIDIEILAGAQVVGVGFFAFDGGIVPQ